MLQPMLTPPPLSQREWEEGGYTFYEDIFQVLLVPFIVKRLQELCMTD